MHLPTSPVQLLVIAVVVLALFGRGKVSSLMGEVGKGITAFKKGLGDAPEASAADRTAQPTKALEAPKDLSNA